MLFFVTGLNPFQGEKNPRLWPCPSTPLGTGRSHFGFAHTSTSLSAKNCYLWIHDDSRLST